MGYKGCRVIYATHALRRAKERGVSQQDILETIEAPDADVPSRACPGRRVLRRRFSSSYEVWVVIVPPGPQGDVGVVTVWDRRG